MRSPRNPWRRGLASALATLHLGLALGAGIHAGPHRDLDVAWLPIDFHPAYGFAVASPDLPRPLDLCVACQLSRLMPRLPAPAATLPAFDAPVLAILAVAVADPRTTDLVSLGVRAPPIA